MENTFTIEKYCHVSSQNLSVNGTVLYESGGAPSKDFLKEIYRNEKLAYPKFFKMDVLSQLTFITAELVLSENRNKPQTALVLSNKSSSVDTDRRHQESIATDDAFFPSPAVFVYTLPNIGMGEVAIRHQLQTENAFFVFEQFDAEFLHQYCESLRGQHSVSQVLCGWTEVHHDVCEAFVYLLSENGKIPHTLENLEKLYAQL